MCEKLPITSIEQFHLNDDSTDLPNVICCDIEVSGAVDIELANAALQQVLGRHPLVYARQQGKHWVLDPKLKEQCQFEVLNELDTDQNGVCRKRVAQPNGALFRPVMVCGQQTTQLCFRVHHSICDGLGGLQFVIDWLSTYHRLHDGSKKPRSRKTNAAMLAQRNHLRLLTRQFIGKLWLQPIAIFGASKFMFRSVVPVGQSSPLPQGDSTEQTGGDFQVLQADLDEAEFAVLKQRSSQANVNTNELILRAVFLAIHQVRKQMGLHRKNEWLRLIVPINIRDFADRRLPAANRATLVQIDRNDRDFADPEKLIAGLNRELGVIKRCNLEKTFLLILRIFSAFPGAIARSAKRDICRATSVVTNLGAPFERVKLARVDGKLQAGNLILEGVRLIVPLRPKTAVGFAVLRYAGRQVLCLHFDPRQIDQEMAQKIMDLVLQDLRREQN